MAEETTKLANVLRRIARAAGYAAWNKSAPDAAQFCAQQYNKVLARLSELEPAVRPLFTELPEDASPEVIRIAARELAAYFEEDGREQHEFYRFHCGGRGGRGVRFGRVAVHCG
jgi:hypothetical protein